MFKRLSLALALCLMFAMPAAAEVNGIYAGVKIIDSIQNKWVGGSLDASYTQNTIGGGIFVGYDFYPQSQIPLRAEIEYAIRSNVTQEKSLGSAMGSTVTGKGTWGLQTLMANFYYDFHNSTAFTPYVGAGLGMGFVSSKYEIEWNNWSTSKDETNTVFAWNVGLGCAYAFNENISADLGYRYVGLGVTEDMKVGDYKMNSTGSAHEFSLGMRVTF